MTFRQDLELILERLWNLSGNTGDVTPKDLQAFRLGLHRISEYTKATFTRENLNEFAVLMFEYFTLLNKFVRQFGSSPGVAFLRKDLKGGSEEFVPHVRKSIGVLLRLIDQFHMSHIVLLARKMIVAVDRGFEKYSGSPFFGELLRFYNVLLAKVEFSDEEASWEFAQAHSVLIGIFGKIVADLKREISVQASAIQILLRLYQFGANDIKRSISAVFPSTINLPQLMGPPNLDKYQQIRYILDSLNKGDVMEAATFSINCESIRVDSTRVVPFSGAPQNSGPILLDFDLIRKRVSFFCDEHVSPFPDDVMWVTWDTFRFDSCDATLPRLDHDLANGTLTICFRLLASKINLFGDCSFNSYKTITVVISDKIAKIGDLKRQVLPMFFPNVDFSLDRIDEEDEYEEAKELEDLSPILGDPIILQDDEDAELVNITHSDKISFRSTSVNTCSSKWSSRSAFTLKNCSGSDHASPTNELALVVPNQESCRDSNDQEVSKISTRVKKTAREVTSRSTNKISVPSSSLGNPVPSQGDENIAHSDKISVRSKSVNASLIKRSTRSPISIPNSSGSDYASPANVSDNESSPDATDLEVSEINRKVRRASSRNTGKVSVAKSGVSSAVICGLTGETVVSHIQSVKSQSRVPKYSTMEAVSDDPNCIARFAITPISITRSMVNAPASVDDVSVQKSKRSTRSDDQIFQIPSCEASYPSSSIKVEEWLDKLMTEDLSQSREEDEPRNPLITSDEFSFSPTPDGGPRKISCNITFNGDAPQSARSDSFQTASSNAVSPPVRKSPTKSSKALKGDVEMTPKSLKDLSIDRVEEVVSSPPRPADEDKEDDEVIEVCDSDEEFQKSIAEVCKVPPTQKAKEHFLRSTLALEPVETIEQATQDQPSRVPKTRSGATKRVSKPSQPIVVHDSSSQDSEVVVVKTTPSIDGREFTTTRSGRRVRTRVTLRSTELLDSLTKDRRAKGHQAVRESRARKCKGNSTKRSRGDSDLDSHTSGSGDDARQAIGTNSCEGDQAGDSSDLCPSSGGESERRRLRDKSGGAKGAKAPKVVIERSPPESPTRNLDKKAKGDSDLDSYNTRSDLSCVDNARRVANDVMGAHSSRDSSGEQELVDLCPSSGGESERKRSKDKSGGSKSAERGAKAPKVVIDRSPNESLTGTQATSTQRTKGDSDLDSHTSDLVFVDNVRKVAIGEGDQGEGTKKKAKALKVIERSPTDSLTGSQVSLNKKSKGDSDPFTSGSNSTDNGRKVAKELIGSNSFEGDKARDASGEQELFDIFPPSGDESERRRLRDESGREKSAKKGAKAPKVVIDRSPNESLTRSQVSPNKKSKDDSDPPTSDPDSIDNRRELFGLNSFEGDFSGEQELFNIFPPSGDKNERRRLRDESGREKGAKALKVVFDRSPADQPTSSRVISTQKTNGDSDLNSNASVAGSVDNSEKVAKEPIGSPNSFKGDQAGDSSGEQELFDIFPPSAGELGGGKPAKKEAKAAIERSSTESLTRSQEKGGSDPGSPTSDNAREAIGADSFEGDQAAVSEESSGEQELFDLYPASEASQRSHLRSPTIDSGWKRVQEPEVPSTDSKVTEPDPSPRVEEAKKRAKGLKVLIESLEAGVSDRQTSKKSDGIKILQNVKLRDPDNRWSLDDTKSEAFEFYTTKSADPSQDPVESNSPPLFTDDDKVSRFVQPRSQVKEQSHRRSPEASPLFTADEISKFLQQPTKIPDEPAKSVEVETCQAKEQKSRSDSQDSKLLKSLAKAIANPYVGPTDSPLSLFAIDEASKLSQGVDLKANLSQGSGNPLASLERAIKNTEVNLSETSEVLPLFTVSEVEKLLQPTPKSSQLQGSMTDKTAILSDIELDSPRVPAVVKKTGKASLANRIGSLNSDTRSEPFEFYSSAKRERLDFSFTAKAFSKLFEEHKSNRSKSPDELKGGDELQGPQIDSTNDLGLGQPRDVEDASGDRKSVFDPIISAQNKPKKRKLFDVNDLTRVRSQSSVVGEASVTPPVVTSVDLDEIRVVKSPDIISELGLRDERERREIEALSITLLSDVVSPKKRATTVKAPKSAGVTKSDNKKRRKAPRRITDPDAFQTTLTFEHLYTTRRRRTGSSNVEGKKRKKRRASGSDSENDNGFTKSGDKSGGKRKRPYLELDFSEDYPTSCKNDGNNNIEPSVVEPTKEHEGCCSVCLNLMKNMVKHMRDAHHIRLDGLS